MLTVNVELGERGYPIVIGAGLLGDQGLAARIGQEVLRQGKIVIVTNDVVAPLYLEKAEAFFADRDCASIVLNDGEAHKTLAAVDTIYDFLLSNKYDRHTTLVALGGGVVGDITGFAAATYLRGIDCLVFFVGFERGLFGGEKRNTMSTYQQHTEYRAALCSARQGAFKCTG